MINEKIVAEVRQYAKDGAEPHNRHLPWDFVDQLTDEGVAIAVSIGAGLSATNKAPGKAKWGMDLFLRNCVKPRQQVQVDANEIIVSKGKLSTESRKDESMKPPFAADQVVAQVQQYCTQHGKTFVIRPLISVDDEETRGYEQPGCYVLYAPDGRCLYFGESGKVGPRFPAHLTDGVQAAPFWQRVGPPSSVQIIEVPSKTEAQHLEKHMYRTVSSEHNLLAG
jgi:hypothetical protein